MQVKYHSKNHIVFEMQLNSVKYNKLYVLYCH